MDAIKDFLMTPGLNKAHFGKLLYPEADKEYQASMLMQFYHKLWGKKRTFSEGELKRMETIIDQWVGDLITKYENIKALSNSLH